MFSLLTISFILYGLAAARSSNFPDFLIEKEETSNEVDGSVGRLFAAPLDPLGEMPCQMDVRVIKRVPGKCVKGSEACVAGSFVHPFHHDCLMNR